MAAKPKGRIAPRIDEALLTETFSKQLASGSVHDALVADMALPPLVSPRGQAASIEGCIWRSITLSDPKAQRLRLRDARIESSDLANIDMAAAALERVEFLATRSPALYAAKRNGRACCFRSASSTSRSFAWRASSTASLKSATSPKRISMAPISPAQSSAGAISAASISPTRRSPTPTSATAVSTDAGHARCHGWPHHQPGPGRAAYHPLRCARRVVILFNSPVAAPVVFPGGSATRSPRGSAPVCRA